MSFRALPTPYGAAALRVLRDVVATTKRDDPMAMVTLLVPSNLAGIVARRALAQGLTDSADGIAALHITTLARLGERLAAPTLHPRRPATTSLISAAWRAELARGSLFDRVRTHPATVRALVSAHRELRDLSPAALAAVAEEATLAAEVVRMHSAVTRAIAADWYDTTDLLAAAADLVAAGGGADVGTPVLYLPQRLTRAEARLAEALAASGEVPVVLGLTGVQRADRAVSRSLASLGIEAAKTVPPRTATAVMHASDADDEVACVVRDVVETLSEVPAHRVAVLYAADSPYARLLAEKLAAAGVAINGRGTRPVVERAMGRSFLDVLRLAQTDLPRADLFTALAEAPARTHDGQQVPVSRWERISRSAAIVGGTDWDVRLRAYADSISTDLESEQQSADPRPATVDRLQRELGEVRSLLTFATALRDRLLTGRRLSDWPALSRWAGDLFTDLYGDLESLGRLPAEEQYAAVAVTAAIRSLDQLASFEAAADLDALVDALTLELESALPRVGRYGDGLLVAPLGSAVGLDADVVYVLGLSEDGYPGRIAEDALLSERARARSGGELASLRDSLDAKHRHLLAAYDAAPRVVATFPRGDLRRSTHRLPSRWLLPTLRELSGDRRLAATAWATAQSPSISGSPSYARSLTGVGVPASEQEWRTRAVSAGEPMTDGVVEAARQMLRARASADFTRFDGNLSGTTGLPNYADGMRPVSPTALESYATCPHAFFVRRLLRVEPLEQPEQIVVISALDIGSLMHETMDAFVTECGDSLPGYGERWTSEQRQRLREIAEAKADDYERRGATGHQALWLAERDRIMADLDYLLDNDEERRAVRNARVRASELAFGMRGAPPVAIAVEGGTVLMRGSADKVDETADGTLIVIDLKTGSQRTFKPIQTDALAAGTKLQLPVYAEAARQLLGGERAEAAYWFVRQGKRGWIELTLTDELAERYAAAVGTLVHSIATGLFPAKTPETPDYAWVQCEYCNPDGIGYGEARTRWERKRSARSLARLVALIDPEAAVPS